MRSLAEFHSPRLVLHFFPHAGRARHFGGWGIEVGQLGMQRHADLVQTGAKTTGRTQHMALAETSDPTGATPNAER